MKKISLRDEEEDVVSMIDRDSLLRYWKLYALIILFHRTS